jgi:hypothetical protein
MTYVPINGGFQTAIHNAPHGEGSVPPIFPAFVYRGVDMTEQMRLLQTVPVDPAKSEEVARNMVVAKNPLRPGAPSNSPTSIKVVQTVYGSKP